MAIPFVTDYFHFYWQSICYLRTFVSDSCSQRLGTVTFGGLAGKTGSSQLVVMYSAVSAECMATSQLSDVGGSFSASVNMHVQIRIHTKNGGKLLVRHHSKSPGEMGGRAIRPAGARGCGRPELDQTNPRPRRFVFRSQVFRYHRRSDDRHLGSISCLRSRTYPILRIIMHIDMLGRVGRRI